MTTQAIEKTMQQHNTNTTQHSTAQQQQQQQQPPPPPPQQQQNKDVAATKSQPTSTTKQPPQKKETKESSEVRNKEMETRIEFTIVDNTPTGMNGSVVHHERKLASGLGVTMYLVFNQLLVLVRWTIGIF